MTLTKYSLKKFLAAVDMNFPVPLSQKQDIETLTDKFLQKATLCYKDIDGEIVSLVAGYTENVINDLAYISVVATLPDAAGKGYASQLVRDFLCIAKEKGLYAVHLYVVRSNIPAVKMYSKLGFVEWIIDDEPRPDDLHMICYLEEEDKK